MLTYLSEADSDGKRVVVCTRCNYQKLTAWPVERVNHECPGKPPRKGPGTHLEAILRQLQIRVDGPGCRCLEMKVQMDYWGPEGCRQNRETILNHLRKKYNEADIPTKITALRRALSQGLPKTLEGLLDEAIRRSEHA